MLLFQDQFLRNIEQRVEILEICALVDWFFSWFSPRCTAVFIVADINYPIDLEIEHLVIFKAISLLLQIREDFLGMVCCRSFNLNWDGSTLSLWVASVHPTPIDFSVLECWFACRPDFFMLGWRLSFWCHLRTWCCVFVQISPVFSVFVRSGLYNVPESSMGEGFTLILLDTKLTGFYFTIDAFFSRFSFLHLSLRHGSKVVTWTEMAATEHRKTHDVEHTEKIVPLITCEITFGQHVCELVFRCQHVWFGLWGTNWFCQTTNLARLCVSQSESWNKPNRQCWAVSVTWQHCRWSLVWWM